MNEEEPKDRGEFAVFEVYGKTLHYSKNSLFILGQDNPLRVRVVKIVAHPWFDRFILFLILVNSVVLALTDWSVIDEDPASSTVGEPSQAGSWRNKLLFRSEPIFTAFFTTEFVLKVIAQGFCLEQGSYLRNAWNILDFIVVVTALLSNIPEVPSMSAIRVFRVLRPLRSVSALPGLQKLVLAMLSSVPQLVSVVVLLAFIFTVFGIFGVQIFGGKQHGRCRLTPYPVNNTFKVSKGATRRTCVFNNGYLTNKYICLWSMDNPQARQHQATSRYSQWQHQIRVNSGTHSEYSYEVRCNCQTILESTYGLRKRIVFYCVT